MTVQRSPLNAKNGSPLATPPAGNRTASRAESIRSLYAYLVSERRWLLLLIPYLLAWVAPFPTQDMPFDGILRWCLPRWSTSNGLLAFQPLIPLGAGLLIWSRRQQLQIQWERLIKNYPPTHPKRRGNPIVFIFGCCTLVFSYCVQVKGIAIGAEIIIVAGAIFWVYGLLVLQALVLPLAFFCLMMPPPDSIIERLAGASSRFSTEQAVHLLRIFAHANAEVSTSGTTSFLKLNGYGLQMVNYFVDGSGNLVCTVILLFWYSLYRRLKISAALTLLALGGCFAAALNIVRIAVGGLAYGSQPGLASLLIEDSPFNRYILGWIIDGTACALAWYTTRGLYYVATRLPSPVKTVIVRTELAADAAAKPIIAGLAFTATRFSGAWNRSERRIEATLNKLFPKRRKRYTASPWSKFVSRMALRFVRKSGKKKYR